MAKNQKNFCSLLGKVYNMSNFLINDRCEIRTRATEVTGALNQRLRPLGQPTAWLPKKTETNFDLF